MPSMDSSPEPHRRRPRYSGTHPRKFQEKYKELNPEKYPEDVEKVLARGATPAGTHRSIMVAEMLECLKPQGGDTALDLTLGFGGHTRALLKAILPGGRLFGFDLDPVEQPKTIARLRDEGFGPEVFTGVQSNFSEIRRVVKSLSLPGADIIFADLGVSSMQIDDPSRGFAFKINGPLDMRMNPGEGLSAAEFLGRISTRDLAQILQTNGDEPDAQTIARAIVNQKGRITTTQALVKVIEGALVPLGRDEEQIAKAVRRTFQGIRIAVNDEFGSLDKLLRDLPFCLKSQGRVGILTFHSGEDNRVVRAFEEGLKVGVYKSIFDKEIRAGSQERYDNPRSVSARLRWAVKA